MFALLGRLAVHHRRAVIVVWLFFILISLPIAPGVARALQPGGFSSGDLESQRAISLLSEKLGIGFSSVQVFLVSERLRVGDPVFRDQAIAATAGLQNWNAISTIVSYEQNPAQVSTDGRAAYLSLILPRDAQATSALVGEIRSRLAPQPDLEFVLGGAPVFFEDIQQVSEADLRRAELIALPFAVIALLIVFRSVVAAALPAVVGGVATLIALALIALIGRTMPLSIFVLNTATLFGLGLGVDYSLFLVSRFREELSRHRSVDDAVIAAIGSAGRAIFFSGLTVAIGLGALLLFRFNMLRSVGLGGLLVVIVAVAAALTLLPAVLSLLGHRVNSLSLPMPPSRADNGGLWHRLALLVMARPIAVLVPVLVILLALGAPFLRARLGAPDESILPAGYTSRTAFELLRDRFPGGSAIPIVLAVQTPSGSVFDPENVAALHRYVSQILADPRVERVDSIVSLDPRFRLEQYQLMYSFPDRIGDGFVEAASRALARENTTLVRIVPKYAMLDSRSTDLVGALRNSRPSDLQVLVSGGSAGVVDYVNTLYHDFPIAVVAIMAVTYVVLLALLRSVLLPLKAIAMNLLSILASYGALVVVFQEGALGGLLGFEALGFVEASIPIIMFCALFGLSMDYEVFLLTRVQEAYQATRDNRLSVAIGLEQSGRIVTSAALIVVTVSLAFLTADVILVKALGLGTALAVFLDATLVRGLLVPATMRLLGDWNWWLPSSLDRWIPRFEHEGPGIGSQGSGVRGQGPGVIVHVRAPGATHE